MKMIFYLQLDYNTLLLSDKKGKKLKNEEKEICQKETENKEDYREKGKKRKNSRSKKEKKRKKNDQKLHEDKKDQKHNLEKGVQTERMK